MGARKATRRAAKAGSSGRRQIKSTLGEVNLTARNLTRAKKQGRSGKTAHRKKQRRSGINARAKKRMPSGKKARTKKTVDLVDLQDRISDICDVVQTVGDAIEHEHNTLPAAVTLMKYGLYPLIAMKEELQGADVADGLDAADDLDELEATVDRSKGRGLKANHAKRGQRTRRASARKTPLRFARDARDEPARASGHKAARAVRQESAKTGGQGSAPAARRVSRRVRRRKSAR
jgi:hypothetical protein